MNYREYERALMLGYSESEAVAIGEDAYINEMMLRKQHGPEPDQPLPLCDICGAADAVTETDGYLVCSESCYLDARSRERKQ